MQSLKFSISLLISLFLVSVPANLLAQERETQNFLNRASQYYLGGKDEILIKVNVWGLVRSPGQYMVPRHTDLISLISFAGGPTSGANLSKVRIIREDKSTTAQNGHYGHAETATILSVDMKSYLEHGKLGVIPTLDAGDTVLVPQTFGNKFQSILGVTTVVGLIAATATLVFAIERL